MVSASLEMTGPAAEELWGWFDRTRVPPLECLVEGPAGTGKTRTILEFVRSYVEQHPGVRVLMMRDIRADMSGTAMTSGSRSFRSRKTTGPWRRRTRAASAS